LHLCHSERSEESLSPWHFFSGILRFAQNDTGDGIGGVGPGVDGAMRFLASLGMTHAESAVEDPGLRGLTSPGASRHPLQRGTLGCPLRRLTLLTHVH